MNQRRQTQFAFTPRTITTLNLPPSPAPSFSSDSTYTQPTSPTGHTNLPTRKGNDSCLVAVRLRPLTDFETVHKESVVWSGNEESNRIWMSQEYSEKLKRPNSDYSFDHVLLGSDNHNLYNTTAKNIVFAAMEGINGTVFAYGQTASGKTYSMMGVDEQPGVIPQAVDDVFNYIREQPHDKEYLLRVSYMEIYNETIRDLLSNEQLDIRIHEDRKRGVYVSPLKEEIVTSPKQVMKVIQRGEQARHWGATDFNERSSRSHTIFQMIIESRDRTTPLQTKRTGISSPNKLKTSGSVFISQLNLIDLAGSEKATTDLERRKEGGYINKSLLTLANVISKLTEERGVGHIPFRDSKLTRILQTSLSGNSNISVICTVSPAAGNWEETTNTLKFASRVKKVSTNAKQNAILDDKALLQKYKSEITQLRTKLLETNEMLELTKNSQLRNNDVVALQMQRQKMEEELHESQLVRTALKERIDHLMKLILSSGSITSKPILDWNAPLETGDKRASVILDGLLPSPSTMTFIDSETSPSPNTQFPTIPRSLSRRTGSTTPTTPTLSRSLTNKDLLRQHISDLELRDSKIKSLESLVAYVKSYAEGSGDEVLKGMVGEYERDSEKVLVGVEVLKGEVERLKRDNEHLEIVCQDQSDKMEVLERKVMELKEVLVSGGNVGGNGGGKEEEYRVLERQVCEQRDRIAELVNRCEGKEVTIRELQHQLEKYESYHGDHNEDGNGSNIAAQFSSRMITRMFNRPDGVQGGMYGGRSQSDGYSRYKEMEKQFERERSVRVEEQRRANERIAELEAELTIARSELNVSNVTKY